MQKFALLFFLPLFSYAQTSLKGTVCNTDKQALQYVNIVSLATNNGASTNQNGEFEITGLNKNDTLKMSEVGYEPKLMAVAALRNTDTIFLTTRIKNLNEIKIKPFTHEQDLGFATLQDNASFNLIPGSQLALFIENRPKQEGWIKGVSFRVKAKGKCSSTMRVRLLYVDSLLANPSADMLSENVLINSADLKKSNYIDLRKYNLSFPPEGVFVVLEWVYTDTRCDKNSYTTIAANMAVATNLVWLNYRDKPWHGNKKPRMADGNYMTPDIGLKVAYR